MVEHNEYDDTDDYVFLERFCRVSVRARTSKPGKGLTYPAFSGILLEEVGSRSWDVVDVRKDDGEEVSIYTFSIEE